MHKGSKTVITVIRTFVRDKLHTNKLKQMNIKVLIRDSEPDSSGGK